MQEVPEFTRAGKITQIRIASARDMEFLFDLPDARWMATSCPVFGWPVDPVFLKFIDSDGNGRILSDDVRAAVRWSGQRLRPSETWIARRDFLPLDVIRRDTDEGGKLGNTARYVLRELGKSAAETVSLADVRAYQRVMANAACNGDGVVPPESITDPELARFARDVVSAYGGAADLSGRVGVDEALIARFIREAAEYLDWLKRGEASPDGAATPEQPFGAETAELHGILEKARPKAEQFFLLCGLAACDALGGNARAEDRNSRAAMTGKDVEGLAELLRMAPVAHPNKEGELRRENLSNPCFTACFNDLFGRVAKKALGNDVARLRWEDWRRIDAAFAGHRAWLAARPATPVSGIGADRLLAYLEPRFAAGIRAMIARENEAAEDIRRVGDLEKAVLFHQWLFEFVNNFAAMPSMSDPGRKSLINAGTLVVAGRNYAFSVMVKDAKAHAAMAANSGICILYLLISGRAEQDRYNVAAPVTAGDVAEFFVGRRGVFFDCAGRELDAEVIFILENPVSIWASILQPFRRMKAMISQRMQAISESVEKEAEGKLQATGQQIQTSVTSGVNEIASGGASVQPAPQPSPPQGRGIGAARDVMIGVGLLTAGLGTAFKFLVEGASRLANPKTILMFLAVLGGIALVILVATGLSAWFRLRRRDLAVLLQACGWAVNGRIPLLFSKAKAMSKTPPLPEAWERKRPGA